MLRKGHHSVQLDAEAWDRLITWIDLNAPFHGTWTEIAGEARVKPLAQRRRELLQALRRHGRRPGGDSRRRHEQPMPAGLPEPEPPPTAAPIAVPGLALRRRRGPSAGRRRRAGHARRSTWAAGCRWTWCSSRAGEFVMGDDSGYPDERPRSVVRDRETVLDGPLRGDQRAVRPLRSQPRQPRRVEASPCSSACGVSTSTGRGSRSVRVSWQRAVAFCDWLSQRDRATLHACRPKRSGNMPAGPGRTRRSSTAAWTPTSPRSPTWPT